MSVQLLTSIASGPYVGNAARQAAFSQTLDMKAASTSGLNQIRYEIYDYPPGFSVPSGWTQDPSTSVIYFAPLNVTTQPPTITLPASGTQNWGRFMLRLRANNNPNQFKPNLTANPNFDPTLVDESSLVFIPSPSKGLGGLGFYETTQADPLRGSVGPLMSDLRKLEAAVGSGTGGQFNVTLANGLNSNVSTNGLTVLRVGGPTAPFSIGGLLPSVPFTSGQTQTVTIWNTTTQLMTILHEDTSSTAANRITTIRGSAVNPAMRGGSIAILTYDSTLSRWVLVFTGYVDQEKINVRDSGAICESVTDALPAFQAALALVVADPGRRKLWIPRADPNEDVNYYRMSAPLQVVSTGAGNGVVTIEWESHYTPLRAAHMGPVVFCSPAVTAPTFVQDGSTGFWGAPFTGASTPYLVLNQTPFFNLHALTACTFEFWINPTNFAVGNGCIFQSTGRRGLSEPITTAISITVDTGGHIIVSFQTTSGITTLTSSSALTTGTRQKVSFAYDSTAGANNAVICIGGVSKASATVTGTLIQLYEDSIIGGQAIDWPWGTPILNSFDGLLYQFRVSNFARSNYLTGYTPETTPFTQDNGTMALVDFGPTNQAGPCGLQSVQVQNNTIGLSVPGWIQWQTGETSQTPGVRLINAGIDDFVHGGVGIWCHQSPGTFIDNALVTNAAYGIVLENNCYNSRVQWSTMNPAVFVGTGTSLKSAKSFGLLVQTGGIINIVDNQIGGGDHCMVLVNGFVRAERCNWIPNGVGCVLVKNNGSFAEHRFDHCFPGDEGGNVSEYNYFFTSQNTTTTGFGSNVVIDSGTTQILQNDGPAMVVIDGGGSVDFQASVWASTLFTHLRVFDIMSQPSTPVTVRWAQQNTSDSSAAAIPWMPETSEVGTLAVTATLTKGSQTFGLSGSATLKKGRKITFPTAHAGIVYMIAADSSGTTGTLVQPFQGTGGAGATVTLVGQGSVLIGTQDARGTSGVIFPSDADFTPEINTVLWKRLKVTITGTQTATRKCFLPLVAGQSWKVWVNTTAGQSITFIGNTGTGVTVAYSATQAWTELYCDGTNIGPG